jgi:hypothetical protein
LVPSLQDASVEATMELPNNQQKIQNSTGGKFYMIFPLRVLSDAICAAEAAEVGILEDEKVIVIMTS